jgi:hypothetical protein
MKKKIENFKAVINPFLRKVDLTIKDYTEEFFFEELDEWNSIEYNGITYDIHFHYDEKIWLHVYKNFSTENPENNSQNVELYLQLNDFSDPVKLT